MDEKKVISEYMAKLGHKGGSKRSKAQCEAFRKHLLGKGGAPKGNKNYLGRLKNEKN